MARCFLAAGLVALVSACASAPAASPSAAEPSATAPVQRGLPPGCQPIDLRSPTGQRVVLTGEWVGSGILANDNELALLNQFGDCLYGSVSGVDADGLETISNLSGRLRSDFTVDFEVVMVFQETRFRMGEYSTMVLRIEWDDDGRIRLREDRQPGEVAGRCIQSQFGCPDPVIWYNVDDAPP